MAMCSYTRLGSGTRHTALLTPIAHLTQLSTHTSPLPNAPFSVVVALTLTPSTTLALLSVVALADYKISPAAAEYANRRLHYIHARYPLKDSVLWDSGLSPPAHAHYNNMAATRPSQQSPGQKQPGTRAIIIFVWHFIFGRFYTHTHMTSASLQRLPHTDRQLPSRRPRPRTRNTHPSPPPPAAAGVALPLGSPPLATSPSITFSFLSLEAQRPILVV